MADLSDLQAALAVKLAGSSSTGVETAFTTASAAGVQVSAPTTSTGARQGVFSTGTPNSEHITGNFVNDTTTTNTQGSLKCSANDVFGVGGIQQVKITYLDQNFAGPFTEIINTNGTTLVLTAATNICYIDYIEIYSGAIVVGSSIDFYLNTTGVGTQAYSNTGTTIPNGITSHWIPAGKTCYVSNIQVTCLTIAGALGATQGGRFLLKSRPGTSPWTFNLAGGFMYSVVEALRMTATGQMMTNSKYLTPIAIQGPAKIGMTAILLDGVTSTQFWSGYSYVEA